MDWLNSLVSYFWSIYFLLGAGTGLAIVLLIMAFDPFGIWSKFIFRVETKGYKEVKVTDGNWKPSGKVGLMSVDGLYSPADQSSHAALFAEDIRVDEHKTGVVKEERRWRLATLPEIQAAQKKIDA